MNTHINPAHHLFGKSRAHLVQGFTLIELLVVIAIIAILAAILFPVFGRARENGRRASCQTSLKQVGIGLTMYVQDFDEVMPFNSYGYVSYDNSPNDWMDLVQPYTKSYQVFKCPSDTRDINPQNRLTQDCSYGVNMIGYNESASSPNGPPISQSNKPVFMSAIGSPSSTVFALDSTNFQFLSYYGWADLWSVPTIDTTKRPREMWQAVERHLETLNVLFCDGHVKAQKLDYLRTPTTGGSQPGQKAMHLTIGADLL